MMMEKYIINLKLINTMIQKKMQKTENEGPVPGNPLEGLVPPVHEGNYQKTGKDTVKWGNK